MEWWQKELKFTKWHSVKEVVNDWEITDPALGQKRPSMGCCQAEHKHTYVLALVSLPGKIPFLNYPETQTWEIKPIFFPIDVFFFFLNSIIQKIGRAGDIACHLNLRVNGTCPWVAFINYNQENKLGTSHFSHWLYWWLSYTSTQKGSRSNKH